MCVCVGGARAGTGSGGCGCACVRMRLCLRVWWGGAWVRMCVLAGGREVDPQHLFKNFLCEFFENNLHWICASECLHTYIRRTNKLNTFFINDLFQLYCLQRVSNNQVSIIRKTV